MQAHSCGAAATDVNPSNLLLCAFPTRLPVIVAPPQSLLLNPQVGKDLYVINIFFFPILTVNSILDPEKLFLYSLVKGGMFSWNVLIWWISISSEKLFNDFKQKYYIILVVSVDPQIGETKSFVWERFSFLFMVSASVNDLWNPFCAQQSLHCKKTQGSLEGSLLCLSQTYL